jgi:hypothetical protein
MKVLDTNVHIPGRERQHFEAMAARTQQSWTSSDSVGHRHHLQRTFRLADTSGGQGTSN